MYTPRNNDRQQNVFRGKKIFDSNKFVHGIEMEYEIIQREILFFSNEIHTCLI